MSSHPTIMPALRRCPAALLECRMLVNNRQTKGSADPRPTILGHLAEKAGIPSIEAFLNMGATERRALMTQFLLDPLSFVSTFVPSMSHGIDSEWEDVLKQTIGERLPPAVRMMASEKIDEIIGAVRPVVSDAQEVIDQLLKERA